MPRRGYIPKTALNTGRGVRMEYSTLKKVLIRIIKLDLKPSQAEKKLGLKHGRAVNFCRKLKELGLTVEQIDAMTPDELGALWYKKKPRSKLTPSGEEQPVIRPNIAQIYEAVSIEKKAGSGGSRMAKKLVRSKEQVIREQYLENPAVLEQARQEGAVLLSIPRIYAMLKRYENEHASTEIRKEHLFGEEAQYDFTGVVLPYGDRDAPQQATFMLGVLPASGYMYAEAIRSQKTEDVMPCFANSFKFWGGTPACLRVDNFKAAISEASDYGGVLTPAMDALARFFDVEVYACRPNCPKDKGCVEAHVKLYTRYALAAAAYFIRCGGWFNSLKELNDFLRPYLKKINSRARRGCIRSRSKHFKLEQSYLRKPASWDYHLVETRFITVPPTASFVYKKHEYAIHPKWCGCRISVEIAPETITFASGSCLIAVYPRQDGKSSISARPGFLETKNEIYEIECIDSQGPMLKEWAEAIGPNTLRWVEKTLQSRTAYADKVRHIVKVLSLPMGFIARHQELDGCIEALLKHYGRAYFPPKKIIDAFEALEHSQDTRVDALHNQENYFKAGRDVIYGRAQLMSWKNCIPLEQTVRPAPREFLNGGSYYGSRYAGVEAALAGDDAD